MPDVEEKVKNAKSKKVKKVVAEKAKKGDLPKTKTKPIPKKDLIILTNLNAIQVITSGYAGSSGKSTKSKKVIVVKSKKDDLPQTIIDGLTTSDDEPEFSISELLHDKSKRCMLFLNSHKTPVKSWGVMIDLTQSGPLPLTTKKPCWWCRNTFHTQPVGCPIKYFPNLQDPNSDTLLFLEKLETLTTYPTTTHDFFETEGLFCSGPCCKAYIRSQHGKINTRTLSRC